MVKKRTPSLRILAPQKWLIWGPKHPCVIQVLSPFHWRVQGFLGLNKSKVTDSRIDWIHIPPPSEDQCLDPHAFTPPEAIWAFAGAFHISKPKVWLEDFGRLMILIYRFTINSNINCLDLFSALHIPWVVKLPIFAGIKLFAIGRKNTGKPEIVTCMASDLVMVT